MSISGTALGNVSEQWDWQAGKRVIMPSVAPKETYLWQEEPCASPDGECFAAVIRLEDESFSVRVNNSEWEESFEKLWRLRYTPHGRLTSVVMADDEWTVAVDGAPWEERFAFAWNTMFGKNDQIYVAIQQDMQYGVCADGTPWDNLYINANNIALRADGKKSAAVVQVKALKQADLETFTSGIFSVAVDGEAWDATFMNLWSPVFDSRGGERIAAAARLSPLEYTIVVNGEEWPAIYDSVWEPAFDPASGALAAPVRKGGKWGVAIDAGMQWSAKYFQCWNLQWSNDGKHLWGIVAPEYGKFTIAHNDTPWSTTFPVVTDLTLSPHGTRAAALASHQNADFRIVVDGTAWQGLWDMAYKPVFCPKGESVAALVRKADSFTYMVNGKPVKETFSRAWEPMFSPDGTSVLLRGIQNNSFVRIVLPIGSI